MESTSLEKMLKAISDIDTIFMAVYHINRDHYGNGRNEIKTVESTLKYVFKHLMPFRVGDEVELMVDPAINSKDSWGWMPYKHFLQKGLKSRIIDIFVWGDNLRAIIEPLQTKDGSLIQESHHFPFNAKDLKLSKRAVEPEEIY